MSDDTLIETRPTDFKPTPEQIQDVVIRFAGDSGDGMQLAGTQFTESSALFGNDLSTLPDFPAEIRAPQGTIGGVSSFQVHIADWDILTPGDRPDCLVAMNPAALRANIRDLVPGGLILVNTDAFDERNLGKAGYQENPLENDSLDTYTVLRAPMEELTKEAVKDSGVKGRAALRSKNFFALGLMSWIYTRPLESITGWIDEKFGSDTPVGRANAQALQAGYNYGITTEAFHHTFEINPAPLPAGEYTNVVGNVASAWGLMAAGEKANLPLFLGSYPITPATTILEELARHRNFGVKTFQAEDEIAGIGASLGAAFSGHLAITTTSGPGLALKSETLSLALMVELPLIVIDVQRGGPSTGLPTKVEQSDLLFAMYGRHGESPLPIVSTSTPSDAFDAAFEAARIAIKYMTPVILLTDGYIATSSEPWMLPDLDALPDISRPYATLEDDKPFLPYERDPETMARPWAIPGQPGLEHRIGGLEKDAQTGNVSYDPENHEHMSRQRAAKIAKIQDDIAELEVHGDGHDLLVLGWGSTYGAIRTAVNRVQKGGGPVAHAHLRHINPFPKNLGDLLSRYDRILIPEINLGQLSRLIRAEYGVESIGYNRVLGQPLKAREIQSKILEILNPDAHDEVTA
ncbi:MAG: 2-oxoacid:acceptor oxidoreductase subunit alpha [Actinomycetota bacterium]|nr:2-oxoacid:acceptor oxidoreductase subunit alpha [Actinomycetota bacterium]